MNLDDNGWQNMTLMQMAANAPLNLAKKRRAQATAWVFQLFEVYAAEQDVKPFALADFRETVRLMRHRALRRKR